MKAVINTADVVRAAGTMKRSGVLPFVCMSNYAPTTRRSGGGSVAEGDRHLPHMRPVQLPSG